MLKHAVKNIKHLLQLAFAFIGAYNSVYAQTTDASVIAKMDTYNVIWNTPGDNSKGAMPIGNGDIGANVWVEKNGDLLMYVAKTDAWSEEVFSNEGLLKLGRLRFHFSNSPFTERSNFTQSLLLTKGKIEIVTPAIRIQVWIDANHPVAHVETETKVANTITVTFESLRSKEALAAKDTLIKSKLHTDNILNAKQQVVWLYENSNAKIAALKYLKFGAIVQGDAFINSSNTTLVSAKPALRQHILIAAYTGHEETAEAWLQAAQKLYSNNQYSPTLKAAHENWWKQFWLRSWIFVDGDKDAELVSRTYQLQRYLSACGGRGAYPAKFNGSLFTMDDTLMMKRNGINSAVAVNGDFRSWGGRYWFQNTRHQFWPMLAAGGFDMMQPFFQMYIQQIPFNKSIIQKMYGFDGLIFGEQQPFWGGLPNGTDAGVEGYSNHYFSQVMELATMLLDYYSYTGDKQMLQQYTIPIADGGATFYANRFKKDSIGKLVFEPANAMETFWKVKNPSSEIAGFRYVLQRLLQLPDALVGGNRKKWESYLAMAPEIPIGTKNNVEVIAASETINPKSHNTENPELYAIFPFRLYGIHQPQLNIAFNTFNQRIHKRVGCWHHDILSAALLGKTEEATNELIRSCTYTNAIDNKNNTFRFFGFLGPGHDYSPDLDHGGVIMMGLQYMLLQENDKDVDVLPAFPKQWNVNFKLHTSQQRIVQVEWRNGKMVSKKIENKP